MLETHGKTLLQRGIGDRDTSPRALQAEKYIPQITSPRDHLPCPLSHSTYATRLSETHAISIALHALCTLTSYPRSCFTFTKPFTPYTSLIITPVELHQRTTSTDCTASISIVSSGPIIHVLPFARACPVVIRKPKPIKVKFRLVQTVPTSSQQQRSVPQLSDLEAMG